jgi:hypothetical protein
MPVLHNWTVGGGQYVKMTLSGRDVVCSDEGVIGGGIVEWYFEVECLKMRF